MKNLLKCLGLGVGLAISAGVAVADEAGDYLAAAGDQVKAFAACMVRNTKPLVGVNTEPEALADKAMKACNDEADAIRDALKGAPTHLSDDNAQETANTVTTSIRDTVVEEIKKKQQE